MQDKDGKAFSDASLLLAEDDLLNADIACRILRKLGCHIEVASDGFMATRMWEEGDFDLILMDCEMAEMDGFDASRKIREREKEAGRRHTPIVALSAHAPAEIRERCLAAGMDDVLAKPFREALLRDTLQAWIGGEKPVRAAVDEQPVRLAAVSVDRRVLDSITAFQGSSGQLLLKSIVGRFADAAHTQLGLLRKNHTEGETEEVRRIAHTLKSSSAALGANCVSQCCAEIEKQASKGETAPLPAALSALEQELSAALRNLREIVGEREELHRVHG